MNRPSGYSIKDYGEMITDEPRMEAYTQALSQAITPGCIVLDIGAGTGIFSILACQLGARKVHAVESDGSIDVARAIAAANGYSAYIQFHPSLSTQIDLEDKVDVVVSDLRGVLPLNETHIPSIIDARERMLASGGRFIPQADELWASLVECPDIYRSYEEPWLKNAYGLDMQAGHKFVTGSMTKVRLRSDQLLVEPKHIRTIDYKQVTDPDMSASVGWIISRSGTCHGMAVWFDARIADGIGFSNAPGQRELIYGQMFFPWRETVALKVGDVVEIEIHANLINGNYVWRWSTAINGSTEVDFEQSTFYSSALSLENLLKQEAAFVPSLKEEGELDKFLLSLFDGKTNLESIARQAADKYSDHFKDWKAALTRAGELSRKYSR